MYVDCFVEMVYIKVHIVLTNVNTDMTHCRCELVYNQLNKIYCKNMLLDFKEQCLKHLDIRNVFVSFCENNWLFNQ